MCLDPGQSYLIFVLIAQIVAGSEESLVCGSNDCEQPLRASNLLMKSTQKSVSTVVEAEMWKGRSYAFGKPALRYYMLWADGKIANILSRNMTEVHHNNNETTSRPRKSDLTAERTILMLTETRARQCPGSVLEDFRNWVVYDHAVVNDVHHTLLRSSRSHLQYLATHNEHILVADPPACSELPAVLQESSANSSTKSLGPSHPDPGGADKILHPEKDPLVQDCVKLFHRTAIDICKQEWKLEVLSARMRIIDGFEVDIDARLTNGNGTITYHRPSCLFEVSQKYRQDPSDVAVIDPLPEENNMTATLQLHTTNLCDLSEKNSTKMGLVESALARTGELSFYKGFEHVNDKVPFMTVMIQSRLPDTIDLRSQYPMCFPGQFFESVVRNQGRCGSCWAFASASSTMANLCIHSSGKRVLKNDPPRLANSGKLVWENNHLENTLVRKDPPRRLEISVQQIMSCNTEHYGCAGGWAASADDAFRQNGGFSNEETHPYKCGSGSGEKHFTESNECQTFPWNYQCARNSIVRDWGYGGFYAIQGEDAMKTILSQGKALWMYFEVYTNFLSYNGKSIYAKTEGKLESAHAVTGLGYGVQLNVKYWLLQNSWGNGWGESGYFRFLRGSNLASIEWKSYVHIAWVHL